MKKKKILVIDDEKDFCKLFKESLIREGYEVITALSGLEGIEKVKESSPDIIFLDLKMPEMDGIETLGHIRKIDKNAVVIILTAYPSMDTALKAYYLNIYDYVKKPFTIKKVRDVIKKALGEKK